MALQEIQDDSGPADERSSPGTAASAAGSFALEAIKPSLPELLGGSADLTGSNLTMVKASKVIGREDGGSYLFYGVREFGMCAVMNGTALHGGFTPYGGTRAPSGIVAARA